MLIRVSPHQNGDNRRRQMPGASAFVLTPKRGERRTGNIINAHRAYQMAPFIRSGHNIAHQLTPLYKRGGAAASGFAVNLVAHTVNLDVTRPIGGGINQNGFSIVRYTDQLSVPNNVWTVTAAGSGTVGSVPANTQTLNVTVDGTLMTSYTCNQAAPNVPNPTYVGTPTNAEAPVPSPFNVYPLSVSQCRFNTTTREWIDQLTAAANSGTFELRVSAIGGADSGSLSLAAAVGTWTGGNYPIQLPTGIYVARTATATVQVRDAASLVVLGSVTHTLSNDMHT